MLNKMKLTKILTIICLSAFALQAQDITNKLGGNTANETYDVTDSADNVLFRVQGDGKVGIGTTTPDELLHAAGNLRLDGTFEDKDGEAGTAGQVLSSTVIGTDWIDPPSETDVTVITTRTASLSAGERALNTYPGGTGLNSINFTIPTAASSSSKVIEVFIGRADVNPGIQFSQAVTVIGNNTSYASDSYYQLVNQYEGIITLVSDGTIWRGFGIQYGGIVCFIAGTKISMADGTLKNIEDIKINDIVASYDFNADTIVNKTVLKTFANPPSKGLVEITFENGTKNINTANHRYFVKDKGWSAVKPNKSESKPEANQLAVGDTCFVISDNSVDETTVSSIKELPNKITNTYNLHVDDSKCYFANGILVHNLY